MTIVHVSVLPLELSEQPRWILWKYGITDAKTGKPSKEPWRLDLSRRASSTRSRDWASLHEAVAAVEAGLADGVGYALPDRKFTLVDLDDVVDDEGVLHPDADEIVGQLDSYSEWSVSGRGVHVLVRATLNSDRCQTKQTPWGGEFAAWDHGRFVYLTGELLEDTPATIEQRQFELDSVRERYFAHLRRVRPERARATPAPPADERDLLEKAFAARNGGDFQRLYQGDTGGYASASEADFAFCCTAAFWTGRDPGRIDAWLRTSGLYRPKWERDDYRERTIAEAIAATSNVYRRNCDGAANAVEEVNAVGGPEGGAGAYCVTASPLYREAVAPTQNPRRENGGASATDSDAVADAEPDPEPQPFALPVVDFVKIERPLREPLLADEHGRAVIGRHSLTLLGALGGHGKTTYSIDVFLHLAAGVDYPPFTVPTPVSVLLIENEGPEELFAAKLKARLAHFEHELKARLDVCVFDWGDFSLADAATRQRLTDEIAANGYDLVFGDPLDSLGIEGVGSPEDTRRFMNLMRETGLNRTVAWWLNCHPRKEETKEALNEISGAWGGKPDSVLLLRMLEDDRTQVRFPKLRWAKRGSRPPILLAFDPDTEAFTFLGEQAEEQRGYLREAFAFVQDHPWQTVKEIAAPAKAGGIGANDATVKKLLEEHPELFESRTGEEAVALGRNARATLWGLRPDAAEKLAALEDER